MSRQLPQRIVHPAPPGALLKRLHGVAERMRLQDFAARDPVHLARVRRLPCLRCGLDPCGEAAHVRLTSAAFNKRGAMAKKPADRFCVPLCAGCHREDGDALHKVGERLFWWSLGINPLLVCERLYAKRGDFVAMVAVVQLAIAERQR